MGVLNRRKRRMMGVPKRRCQGRRCHAYVAVPFGARDVISYEYAVDGAERKKRADTDVGPSVFISYSRKDQAFARRLGNSLESGDYDVYIDQESIAAAGPWREELQRGIENADDVVFVLSPDFVASKSAPGNFNTPGRMRKDSFRCYGGKPGWSMCPALSWLSISSIFGSLRSTRTHFDRSRMRSPSTSTGTYPHSNPSPGARMGSR